jgi:hypothetical protein
MLFEELAQELKLDPADLRDVLTKGEYRAHVRSDFMGGAHAGSTARRHFLSTVCGTMARRTMQTWWKRSKGDSQPPKQLEIDDLWNEARN